MQISVSIVSSVVLSMASIKLTAVMDHPSAEKPLDAAAPAGWRWICHSPATLILLGFGIKHHQVITEDILKGE